MRHTSLPGRLVREITCSLFILCFIPQLMLPSWSQAPTWWTTRGVLVQEAAADDYAAVNQGQVKHIAKQAYEEFKDKLPGGAGAALDAIWASPAASTDDYVAVNVGQLKNVAKPFYDRLIAENVVSSYPWGTSTDDYTLANIGQVKNLFGFSLAAVITPEPVFGGADSDGDGIPDYWELLYGFNPLDSSDGAGQLAGYQRQILSVGKAPETSNALGLLVYTP